MAFNRWLLHAAQPIGLLGINKLCKQKRKRVFAAITAGCRRMLLTAVWNGLTNGFSPSALLLASSRNRTVPKYDVQVAECNRCYAVLLRCACIQQNKAQAIARIRTGTLPTLG